VERVYCDSTPNFKSGETIKWWCYIVECKDGSYYCGVAIDVFRRIISHNNGRGAKYTKGRGPVKLVLAVQFESRSVAQQVEAAIKKVPKRKKVKFLQQKSEGRPVLPIT